MKSPVLLACVTDYLFCSEKLAIPVWCPPAVAGGPRHAFFAWPAANMVVNGVVSDVCRSGLVGGRTGTTRWSLA